MRIRERERLLGILFVSVLVAVPSGGVLILAFPLAGRVVVISVLGIFWLVMVWRLVALRRGKRGRAPVGPLSPDERAKARSKLLTTRRPDLHAY